MVFRCNNLQVRDLKLTTKPHKWMQLVGEHLLSWPYRLGVRELFVHYSDWCPLEDKVPLYVLCFCLIQHFAMMGRKWYYIQSKKWELTTHTWLSGVGDYPCYYQVKKYILRKNVKRSLVLSAAPHVQLGRTGTSLAKSSQTLGIPGASCGLRWGWVVL